MEKKELTLQEIQEASFEVLKKIKEIFDNNGWKYYLAYGTLLGAIRHEGFIPWDDDIDIWVPRDDYEKFIEYCKKNKENLKPFELLHYSTRKDYIYAIARFSDTRYHIDYNNTKDYGLGLFVDIYPLDGIDNHDKKMMKKMYRMFREVNLCGKIKYSRSNTLLKTIVKYLYYLILKNKNLNKLLKKLDKSAQKYNFNNSKYFNCVCWNSNGDANYKKEFLDNGNNQELFKMFNGIEFRVPYNFDGCLKAKYGNYMKVPPENERIGHHDYKAYKK